MIKKLKSLKARDLIKILKKLGFYEARQKGSHLCLKHTDGRFTLVPRHGREDISRGLLRQIMREIKLTPKDFIDLLK